MSPSLAFFEFDLLPGRRAEKSAVTFGALAAAVLVDPDDAVADFHLRRNDAPVGDTPEVIAIVEVRDEHLEIAHVALRRRRDVFHDRLEERLHVFALVMNFPHGVAVAGGGVDDGEIELLIGRVQFEEKLEHEIEYLVRLGVLAVDLVDDDDRLGAILERFFQDELRLRLRAVVGVDDEEHAVDHLHDALDLAAEIRVAGSVHDIDMVVVPFERGVLGANGDALFLFEVHGVHDALLGGFGFVGAEGSGLLQQLVDEGGLAMVDVRDDGDVSNVVHFNIRNVVGVQRGAEYGG